MSKVYITQDLGRTNFLPAEKYGELVSVVQGHVSPTGLKRFQREMQEKLRGITSEDYLLPAGHPALIILAGAIMANRTGWVRVLTWDNITQQYVPSELRII